jgi:hypothetical protein
MSATEDVHARQERAARNQSLFREVNERVKDVGEMFTAATSLADWVCECANDGCVERLELSGEEYEGVRAHGARFLVAPGKEHVWPDVERVVERRERYWVVEKVEAAASVARHNDPRSETP